MKEIYFSVDVESDGPIPGPNSMLSFGAAAFSDDGCILDTFAVNLELLPGAAVDPDTEKFWAKNKEAYASTRVNPEAPEMAMKRFVEWVEGIAVKPVFVAYPAGYDFTFMYWYMIRFAGRSPFSFSAVDIKTFAMAMLRKAYRESAKRNMPKRWFSGNLPHTHIALDDAIEQGTLFCNMLAENKAKGEE